MYLEHINSPADLKKLNLEQMTILSSEIRQVLLNELSQYGGHVGPNLGMVEATIALHYVFNSPVDKIVFDVSHQTYVHKLLTGRRDGYINHTVTGFSSPHESSHDFFTLGHTSTAVSLSCGLAKARDLKGEHTNVVAVVGDGALSGGEAFEGLDNAAVLGSNMIIVVNDNQRSIAENHGGVYANFKALHDSNGACECNFFKAFGFDYIYVGEGNDLASLIAAFQKVKDINHPIVVHINTQKGLGFEPAIKDEEDFHYSMPFDLTTGKLKMDMSKVESYSSLTGAYLLDKMKSNPTLIGVSSGTPMVMGFHPAQRQEAGKQFVDVGIAEEHAVAFSSGFAKGGGRPVYGVYSTFIQRSYDQLSQDLCINNNPAVMLVFLSGVYGIPDVTHLGFFDIPLISNIPNMVYLAPTCKEEYFAMLEWAIAQTDHPVSIRVPSNGVIATGKSYDTDYSQLNKFQIAQKGNSLAIVALGTFYQLGESVAKLYKEKTNVDATLINPRYITGVDKDMLDELKKEHDMVITIEDGVLDGGFGEKIARYYGDSDMRVLNFGLKKEFVDRFQVDELMKSNHLTDEQIVADVLAAME